MMTPIQKGNIGVGMAIGYYTSKGYNVSIPLNDNQDYDLIADINNELKKVQVKTSLATSDNGMYQVYLRTITSSTTGVKKIKNFQDSTVDYLFVATGSGTMYQIPKDVVTQKNQLSLTAKYDCYKVGFMSIS
ncbi:hypothetical protein BCP78_0001 [Bacillus phage BCP78]|uniref:PD(D/E)XK endonuclease domain-containing protein n=2 Tax=Tsarbombavirus BCP78 TaxID=1985182 RepID=A0A2S0CSA0_9CAUD|nr:hypothetical protein BCP78_0001 [Bacillus phage BCP78]AEW47008.1 hypothetical protein BCP78_0001 [Bacillus phage BCP78]AQN32604.1 hypothetical protein BCP12_204 [Bacillus phage BCP12]